MIYKNPYIKNRLLTGYIDMFEKCECQPKYTIEPHGDAYALFFGRCNHRHGYNFMRISDIAHNAPDFKVIEDALNAASKPAVIHK